MPAEWPELHVATLLERLVAGGVDFVVIGGIAVVAHGSARLTRDLDICYSDDPGNLEALSSALTDLRATLAGVTEDVPFVPDGATLRRVALLTLRTDEGRLDVMRPPAGSPPYPKLRSRADRVSIGGVNVLVASVDDLIEMKRAAGRLKDDIDLEELALIKHLRRRVGPDADRRGRPKEG